MNKHFVQSMYLFLHISNSLSATVYFSNPVCGQSQATSMRIKCLPVWTCHRIAISSLPPILPPVTTPPPSLPSPPLLPPVRYLVNSLQISLGNLHTARKKESNRRVGEHGGGVKSKVGKKESERKVEEQG
jgi:hypothetical protein